MIKLLYYDFIISIINHNIIEILKSTIATITPSKNSCLNKLINERIKFLINNLIIKLKTFHLFKEPHNRVRFPTFIVFLPPISHN